MITFEQARTIAAEKVEPIWNKGMGTLYADTVGYEDDKAYAINVGAEEWIIDGEADFMIMDAPLVIVDKETGSASISTYLEDSQRIDKMEKV